MINWPSKGDLAVIPQKVPAIKFDSDGSPSKMLMFERPTTVLVYENDGNLCNVLIDNEIFTVETDKLNKGDNYVSKTNRSV